MEKRIGSIPGVCSARASAARGRVEVSWDGAPDTEAVAAAVTAAGYRPGRAPWLNRERSVWVTFGVALLAVLALLELVRRTDLLSLSSRIGDLQSGGLVVVLLLGLAAGISSCMVLAGGLILAVSAAHTARMDRLGQTPGHLQRLRPHLVFNAGRVVGFAMLGALLGRLGAAVTLPTRLVAALMLLAGLVLAMVGLRLTEISPRLAGWTIHLPEGISRRLGLEEKARHGYSDARTALLGAATFFLPCGFTQAAAIFALSTGSPAYAAAVMGIFALGTAPGLLAFGGLPAILGSGARSVVLRGLGVLVIAFGLVNGASGLRLVGIDPWHPFGNPALAEATTVTSNVEVGAGLQVLNTQQFTEGYYPVHSVVYADLPIRWVIDSSDAHSCAAFLRAPTLGLSVTLQAGPNIFEIPAQPPGRISFSCSMGMYGGDITVISPSVEAEASP